MGRNHLREHQVPKDPSIYLPDHAIQKDHRVLASVSRGYSRLAGSSITCYSPVRHFTRLATFTCDLHASSTPPTFVLSQDQTLHFEDVRPVSTHGFRRGRLAGPASPEGNAYLHIYVLTRFDFEATQNAKDRAQHSFAAVRRAREISERSAVVKDSVKKRGDGQDDRKPLAGPTLSGFSHPGSRRIRAARPGFWA